MHLIAITALLLAIGVFQINALQEIKTQTWGTRQYGDSRLDYELINEPGGSSWLAGFFGKTRDITVKFPKKVCTYISIIL